jgi:hypothetical protein
MKQRGLLVGCAILLAVNALVLAGVGYNRSGTPEASLALTERELYLSYKDKENSAVAIRLNWRDGEAAEPAWFDGQKLAAVGFDCSESVEAEAAELHYRKALPRQAFVVLEYDGAAWQQWQTREKERLAAMAMKHAAGQATRKELEAARKRFAWELVAGSRLFAVDVGNNPASLRARYPDRNRCIITPAKVQLTYHSAIREQGAIRQPAKLRGVITDVLTESIHVPRQQQAVLRQIQRTRRPWQSSYDASDLGDAPRMPRYQVQLNYGKRHEPWLVAVQALPLPKP